MYTSAPQKIKNNNDNWYNIFIAISPSSLCIAVYSHRALYADGVNFIYSLSMDQSLALAIAKRSNGLFILEILPSLLHHANITSYRYLSYAYTLNTYALPMSLWLWALFIVKTNKNLFFIFLALFATVFFGSLGFLFSTHSLNYALSAASFALLLRKEQINVKYAISILILLTLQIKTYESVIFLIPLQIILLLHKIKLDKPSIVLKSILAFYFPISVYTIYCGTNAYLSNTFNATKGEAFYSISILIQSASLQIAICVIVFLSLRLFLQLTFKSKRIIEYIDYITTSALTATCIYYLFQPNWGHDNPWLHTVMRFTFGYILFAFILALTIDKILLNSKLLTNISPGKTGILAIACVIALFAIQDIRFSIGFKSHLGKLYTVINQQDANIIGTAQLNFNSPFYWAWTNELTSVVLADRYPFTIIKNDVKTNSHFGIKSRSDELRPKLSEEYPYIAKGYWWDKKSKHQ